MTQIDPADIWKHEQECDGSCGHSKCSMFLQKKADLNTRLQRYREIAFTSLCREITFSGGCNKSFHAEAVKGVENLAHLMIEAEMDHSSYLVRASLSLKALTEVKHVSSQK
jgi:hypothetical protein